jgi:NADPH:quinone reductase-like Zn-dependent oxidoreductase
MSKTSSLAVFGKLGVPVPDPKNFPAPKDDWALVLGGSSSVGKAAVQVRHIVML